MRSLEQVCIELNRLSPLRKLAALLPRDVPCFLVGGALRDLFLDKPCCDFDFCTPFDPTAVAKAFATIHGGHWFYLDRIRRQSRVILPAPEGTVSYDFGPLRATDLLRDLSLRDFTINAMALRIRSETGPSDFYDPLGGKSDLAHGRLRICSPEVLASDPARILKGVRHTLSSGMHPCDETMMAMRKACPMLRTIAGERLRKELGLILADDRPEMAFHWLVTTGAARCLFGLTDDSWTGEVHRRLKNFACNVNNLRLSGHEHLFRRALPEAIEEGITRHVLLHLSVILKNLPFETAEKVLDTMRFSRASGRVLKGYLNISPARLSEIPTLTCGARGRYWWVSNLGSDPVGCLLLLAIGAFKHNPKLSSRALSLAEEYAGTGHVPDLVDGHDVIRFLGLEPGPEIGRILQSIRREEIAGRVGTVQQAYAFLQNMIQKSH